MLTRPAHEVPDKEHVGAESSGADDTQLVFEPILGCSQATVRILVRETGPTDVGQVAVGVVPLGNDVTELRKLQAVELQIQIDPRGHLQRIFDRVRNL